MAIETLTRPCVHDVTPYFPGKPIAEVQRELGIKRVVKLASNENPLGASPKAVAALRRSVADVNLYPEGASPLLRQALAKELGVAEGQVIIGNGSDEIIRLLCEAFLSPEDEVIVSQYGFIRFKQQAMLMGARVIEVPMADWRHDVTTMGKTVSPRTKLVFVASPNNPTGTYNTREQIQTLLAVLPETALLVLDEAYQHYAAARPDYPDSVKELLPAHHNLVVLRTFSKAYGLAGLRVGYAAADAELVGWLDRIRMPFNVSLPAQRAAIEGLRDHSFVRRSVALVDKNRPLVAKSLRELGFEVPESASNFVFARSPIPGRELFKRLLRAGVIIRPLDEYGLARHVRISIGTAEQNRVLLSAARAIFPKASHRI
ncbi:MAG: histidinol-phosphate transaminase [Elusimicrobia bacterium]|nr:histidinol-phosphate transaminase [Elusimicrobiota bacterium]